MSIENNGYSRTRGNQDRRRRFPEENQFPKEPEDGFLDDDFEDDLFDDISIDEEDDWSDFGRDFEEEDAIVEDLGMEDKIFRQAVGSQKTERGEKNAYEPERNTRNGERRGEPQSAKRKNPREFNTAGSAIDRSKVKREKEQKKKSNIKKIIAWVALEIVTLCLIFGYGYFLRSWNLIERPEIDEAAIENNNISMEKKKEMEGYWDIAIFGVDARGNSTLGKGLNSDVIMVASINMDTGDIKLCSVFRDTYLNVSDKNSYNKINQAYAQGGPEQAVAALNKNLDLNIKNYITFNWKAVADGINILGGIDNINISEAELYYINAYITETVEATNVGSHQLKKTGPQHLDGVQAVAYARLRNMDNDFARTERQKNVIKACFEKAKKADFSVLNNIMVVCFPQVATNISMGDMVRMAQGITKYNLAETGGFPWSRGDARIPGKGSCVIPTTLESNVTMLHQFFYGDEAYTPSSAVLKYSEKIKADSNLYKEGKPIESVRTDQGVIQKPKVQGNLTEREDDDEDEVETSEQLDEETMEYTLGTDENGNLIYPTNEDGDIVIPTDADGNVIYPTDADGNTIKPSQSRPNETRPTDLAEGDFGSEIVDDEGNVIYPGESTRPGQIINPGGETMGRPNERPSEHSTEHGSTTTPGGTHESETNRPGSTHPTEPVTPTNPSPNRPTEIPDDPIIVTPTSEAPSQTPTPGGNSGGSVPGGGSAPGGAGGPGGGNGGPGEDLTPAPNPGAGGPGSGNSGPIVGPGA